MTTQAVEQLAKDLTAGTWKFDPVHSEVEFTARHMMVSKVRGRFDRFDGTITIAEDQLDSSVEVSIDAASINSHDPQRDGHLRSPDFLDVEQFPTIAFRSRRVRVADSGFIVEGDLTIHGQSRPVDLALEFNGVSPDPYGGIRAGFSASTEISRKAFGLEWNVALEAGGFLVGDKVKIAIEVEAIKA